MGNIHCVSQRAEEAAHTREIAISDRASVKISLRQQSSVVNGDHGQIQPETKRQQQELNVQQKQKVCRVLQKAKRKKTENDVETFLSQLADDNNYSRKQMQKLRRQAYVGKSGYYVPRPKLDYRVGDQFLKLISQQERFICERKDQILQEIEIKQTLGGARVRPLHSSNRTENSRTITRNSSFSQVGHKQGVPKVVSAPKNVKEEQKPVLNPEMSHLDRLVSSLQKPQVVGKSQANTHPPSNQNTKPVAKESRYNSLYSFQLQIIIDEVASKITVEEGSDLSEIILKFVEERELPIEFHQKLIDAITQNFAAQS